jgi:hypothetical protein
MVNGELVNGQWLIVNSEFQSFTKHRTSNIILIRQLWPIQL